MDLLNCQIHNILIHPTSYLQLFNEHLLDVRYDSVSQVLCFGRESLLNEEATKDEADTTVNVLYASPPSLWA
jgi:hypothetical protein